MLKQLFILAKYEAIKGSECTKCHQNKAKFSKIFWGGMPPDPPSLASPLRGSLCHRTNKLFYGPPPPPLTIFCVRHAIRSFSVRKIFATTFKTVMSMRTVCNSNKRICSTERLPAAPMLAQQPLWTDVVVDYLKCNRQTELIATTNQHEVLTTFVLIGQRSVGAWTQCKNMQT